MTSDTAIKNEMIRIVKLRDTRQLLDMYTQAQSDLGKLARDDKQMEARAAYRRVLTNIGDELFERGYIMCSGCLKWQNDHTPGSCVIVKRPHADRVHLRALLRTPSTSARLAIIKSMTADDLLDADRDALDESRESMFKENRDEAKLDRLEISDVRDLIDDALHNHGYDYCFTSCEFELNHDMSHCL